MIRLGVTGHRPNRLQLAETVLAARVRAVLEALIRAAGSPSGPALDIQSPLADGADRIVAREALALGQNLTAMLPLEIDDYEKTFADTASAVEFRELLARSRERVELAARKHHRRLAYSAIGLMTVARSDLILTIWDGKEANGQGGTPEILQAALAAGVPVIWINAMIDGEPLLLRADPSSGGAAGADLVGTARQVAKPLNEAAYRALLSAALVTLSSSGKS